MQNIKYCFTEKFTGTEMTSAEPTYVVQVFVTFAPKEPQLQPLVVRVPEKQTVNFVIQETLRRVLDTLPTFTLPSSRGTAADSAPDTVNQPPDDDDDEDWVTLGSTSSTTVHLGDYALCTANGDGSITPQTTEVLLPTLVLRSAPGLTFPYMFALVFTGAHVSEKEEQQAALRAAAAQASSSTPSALSAARQRHVNDAQLSVAQIEQRRLSNLRRLEEERKKKDMSSWHHCDTYEVLRREAQMMEREAALKAKRDAERAEQEALERTRQEARLKQEAEERDIQSHRERMKAAFEAEQLRLVAAQHAVEEAAERRRQEHRDRIARQRQEWEQTKEQRLKASLQAVIYDLEVSVRDDLASREQFLEEQRECRRQENLLASQLHDVSLLEGNRGQQKATIRRQRSEKEAKEAEVSALNQLSSVEQELSQQDAADRRWREWQTRTAAMSADDEDRYEMAARVKRTMLKTVQPH